MVFMILGGGNGIGAAICERLAKEGAYLLVVDIVEEAATSTVQRITDAGGTAEACKVRFIVNSF